MGFWRFMLGRTDFGEANRVVELARQTAMRRPANYIMPGIMTLLLCGLLVVSHAGMADWEVFAPHMTRIIVFDYLMFVFGWLCGWNAASRWRRNAEFVEDIAATNLRPRAVGQILFAGALGVWAVMLVFVFSIDVMATFFVYSLPYPVTGVSTGGIHLQTGFEAFTIGLGWIAVILYYVTLAWFHVETLRIAYWMFSVAALPRYSLRRTAVINFFIIPVYVIVLTAAGSIAAMVCSGIVGIVGAIALPDMNNQKAVFFVFAAGSIPAMLLVGLLKRLIAAAYERSFGNSWVLFNLWGAAETEHPPVYPLDFRLRADQWFAYYEAKDSSIPAPPVLPSPPVPLATVEKAVAVATSSPDLSPMTAASESAIIQERAPMIGARDERAEAVAVFTTDAAFDPLPGRDWRDACVSLRRLVRATYQISPTRMVLAGQVHGATVANVDREARDPGDHMIPSCDALVTATPGVFIAVRTADCLPLVLWDERARVCAVVHAGWRGTRAEIASHAVRACIAAGASRASLHAWIGPCVRQASYEVSPELAADFDTAFERLGKFTDGRLLDLGALNRAQCIEAGVDAANIADSEICTFASEGWHSHRRSGKERGQLFTVCGFLR